HLSARYIPSRQLPDKAISLIDTACARVSMSQAGVPAPVEDRQRRIALIDTEVAILDREMASGGDHAAHKAELLEEREKATQDLARLNDQWQQEKGLAADIGGLRTSLEDPNNPEDKDALREKLAEATAKLRAIQGEHPLIYP